MKESQMANPDPYSKRVRLPVQARIPVTVERGRANLESHRSRRAARHQARLVSARNRRVLAQWLRRTAKLAVDTDPIRRRLTCRCTTAPPVHTDLLEISALLERAHDPDPECIAQLHNLLANRTADSPLYNPHTPFTELEAILDQVHTGP
jgi:hypothetical protein